MLLPLFHLHPATVFNPKNLFSSFAKYCILFDSIHYIKLQHFRPFFLKSKTLSMIASIQSAEPTTELLRFRFSMKNVTFPDFYEEKDFSNGKWMIEIHQKWDQASVNWHKKFEKKTPSNNFGPCLRDGVSSQFVVKIQYNFDVEVLNLARFNYYYYYTRWCVKLNSNQLC